MNFDTTLHIGELLVIGSAGIGVFRGGMAIRDAVRDLTSMVASLKETQRDHEDRIRFLENGDRRWHERRADA